MEAVYVVGQMEIKDPKVYLEQYGKPFMPILKKYKGELIAASDKAEVWEGGELLNWTVLVKFPSKEAAEAFYNSEEYSPLKEMRIQELTRDGSLYMLPGISF